MIYSSDPIRVKPYVKAYLENNFEQEGNLIVIPDRHEIMRLLSVLVSSKRKLRDYRLSPSMYSDDIKLKLTKFFYTTYGYSLTHTNMVIFQCYLEEKVKQRVIDYADALMHTNTVVERKKAIIRSMQNFGLDEDNLPVQTIIKADYRKRIAAKR